MQPAHNEYMDWIKEDVERLNSLCQEARKANIVIATGAHPPPALNPDGSMKPKPPPPDGLQSAGDASLPADARQPVKHDEGYAGMAAKGAAGNTHLKQMLGKIGASLGYQLVVPRSPEEIIGICQKPGGAIIVGNGKGETDATETVQSDYNGDWRRMLDMSAAIILVDKAADVDNTVKMLRKNGVKFAKAHRDRTSQRLPPGYRDFSAKIALPDGFIGEVKIICKGMILAKSAASKAYELTRAIDAKLKNEGHRKMNPQEDAEFRRSLSEMERIYDAAWEACR